MKTTTNKRLQL